MEIEDQENGPKTRDIWIRGLFMLLFMIAFGVGQALLNLTALVQFIWLLVAKEPNQFLRRFGSSLSNWLAEIGRFLSCASDDKPFPWKSWPDSD
jgi:hypothetical protein